MLAGNWLRGPVRGAAQEAHRGGAESARQEQEAGKREKQKQKKRRSRRSGSRAPQALQWGPSTRDESIADASRSSGHSARNGTGVRVIAMRRQAARRLSSADFFFFVVVVTLVVLFLGYHCPQE